MTPTTNSTQFDTLSAAQQEVLTALVAGQSITAAAKAAGVHRTTVHLWTRQQAPFAQALLAARQDKADRLIDELGDLGDLALNTFRHLLSDQNASPATRLKAALEIVKLVESQREPDFHPLPVSSPLPNVSRNAPCPCGSQLKFKRCCARPLPPTSF